MTTPLTTARFHTELPPPTGMDVQTMMETVPRILTTAGPPITRTTKMSSQPLRAMITMT